MVRTQIQLTEEQARAVKKIAAAQGVSSAEIIRRAVSALIRSSAEPDWKRRCSRALEAAGKFSSGKHDVSRKHDDYLTEAFGE